MPWCIQKCPYCDFNSHKVDTTNFDDYIDNLCQDFMRDKDYLYGRKKFAQKNEHRCINMSYWLI